MDNQSFQTVLTILGSTSAFIAVILICGFVISQAQLDHQQRGVLEEMTTGRERYLLRGAAFLLFVALTLIIGIGILVSVLRVGFFDLLGTALLTLPVWISEYYLGRRRSPQRRYLAFVLYVVVGVLFLMFSLIGRLDASNWATLLGILSNSAFVAVQLIVFAIGWGVMVPGVHYEVELTLEGGQKLSGRWIGQSGDDFLLQVKDTVVAVQTAKVVTRSFHSAKK
jgi:hypothetical protein